jgi:hypothetical protein
MKTIRQNIVDEINKHEAAIVRLQAALVALDETPSKPKWKARRSRPRAKTHSVGARHGEVRQAIACVLVDGPRQYHAIASELPQFSRSQVVNGIQFMRRSGQILAAKEPGQATFYSLVEAAQ